HAVYGLLVDGIYDGVATVASFVPVIILFFFLMAVVEDTGYLSRAAFLTDALMARFGLDGRGFVMLLMGFGCNVPALMGTRVMRSRALRLLSMLVIPFSLCSARLQVFLFLTTALFTPHQAPLVLFSLYMVSFAAALGSAALVGRRLTNNEPFVLELPPYRLPSLRQVLLRGWHEVRHCSPTTPWPSLPAVRPAWRACSDTGSRPCSTPSASVPRWPSCWYSALWPRRSCWAPWSP
ncbi:MAG: nucleoside recognition domain-containing protein, partial [Chromatiaceae bacterium]